VVRSTDFFICFFISGFFLFGLPKATNFTNQIPKEIKIVQFSDAGERLKTVRVSAGRQARGGMAEAG